MTPEELWAGLLSEDPAQILAIWRDLTPDERATIIAHLQKMVTEDGWHPLQKQAAISALTVLIEKKDLA